MEHSAVKMSKSRFLKKYMYFNHPLMFNIFNIYHYRGGELFEKINDKTYRLTEDKVK